MYILYLHYLCILLVFSNMCGPAPLFYPLCHSICCCTSKSYVIGLRFLECLLLLWMSNLCSHSCHLYRSIKLWLSDHHSVDVGLLAAWQICTHLPTRKNALLPVICATLVVRFIVLRPYHCIRWANSDSTLRHHQCFWLKSHGMNAVCMETLINSLC